MNILPWLNEATLLVALGVSLLFGGAFQAVFEFKKRFLVGFLFPAAVVVGVLTYYNPWYLIGYTVIMIYPGLAMAMIYWKVLNKGYLKGFLLGFCLPLVGWLVYFYTTLKLKGQSKSWTGLKSMNY